MTFSSRPAKTADLGIRVVIWPNGRNAKLIESYGEKRQGAQLDKAGKVFLGPAKLFAMVAAGLYGMVLQALLQAVAR